MNTDMQPKQGEQELAHICKTTALRGALAITFAIVLLIWPNIGLATLIALFGAFALVSGISTIAAALSLPLTSGRRAWLTLQGLLGITIGTAVVIWPDLSALVLLYAIAAWAITLGILEIAHAFDLPLNSRQSLPPALNVVLSTAFGVIMLAHPGTGAVALLALIAAFALVTGAIQIAFALELRRAAHEHDNRIPPHTTPTPVTQS